MKEAGLLRMGKVNFMNKDEEVRLFSMGKVNLMNKDERSWVAQNWESELYEER